MTSMLTLMYWVGLSHVCLSFKQALCQGFRLHNKLTNRIGCIW